MRNCAIYFGGILCLWTVVMIILVINYHVLHNRSKRRQSVYHLISQWNSTKLYKSEDEVRISSLTKKSASLKPWDVWKQQKARIDHVNELCSKLSEKDKMTPKESKKVKRHFFDNYVHNFRFCYIPKVASKTCLQQFFYQEESIHPSPLRDGEHFRTFVFVREPFIRLLSAYLSKFTNGRKLQLCWERMFGHDIVKRYRDNGDSLVAEWKRAKNMNYTTKMFPFLNVTFKEFVRYILEPGLNVSLNQFTDHWFPQSAISIPCAIQYQFIGKFEEMETDFPFVLKWLGLQNRRPPLVFHESSAKQRFHLEYSQLSIKQILQLKEFYQLDYAIFNYSDTWPEKALRLAEKEHDAT